MSKHYTVWVGTQPGVYSSWREAEANVKGIKGAKFKSFNSEEEANSAFTRPWQDFIDMSGPKAAATITAPEQEHVRAREPNNIPAEYSDDIESDEPVHLINILGEPELDPYGLRPDEAPF